MIHDNPPLGPGPLFGIMVCYPAPGIVERIGPDWDWIWVDGQHGEFGYQDLLGMVRACDLIRRPAYVRTAPHEIGGIERVLDMGAAGVIVPCVDTPEQAQQLVRAAKFPPVGERSYGSRRMIDLHGRLYSDRANAGVKLIVQIETPLGLRNADGIAAVPGVDVLFLGPDDLMLRQGYKMDTPRTPAVLEADMRAVADACRRHGKQSMVPAIGAEMTACAVRCGYDFLAGGTDVMFLAAASKQAAELSRAAAAAR